MGSQFKVNPVSTSMKCVISLTILYFVIYTGIALVRTIGDIIKTGYSHCESILKSAMYTVAYTPMLAILSLARRMLVTWLTQGKGNPPEYVQAAMCCATYLV